MQVILEHRDTGRRPPHVLYTVPTGQNPTGVLRPFYIVINPVCIFSMRLQLFLETANFQLFVFAGCIALLAPLGSAFVWDLIAPPFGSMLLSLGHGNNCCYRYGDDT